MAAHASSRFLFTGSNTLFVHCIVLAVIIHSTGAARELGDAPGSALAALGYWQEKLPGASMPAILRNVVTPLTDTDTVTLVNEVKKSGSVSLQACMTAKFFCDWKNFKGVREFVAVNNVYNCFHGEATCTAEELTADLDQSVDTIKHVSFFRERDLSKGNQITFPDQHEYEVPRPAFLPQGLAEMFPLGVTELPGLLQKFGIPRDSLLAASMRRTVTHCDQAPMKGEVVACATSLEAMADFVASSMRSRKVEVLAFPGQEPTGKEPLTVVESIVKADSHEKYVACHNAMFTFGVYYCHQIGHSRVYEVSLQGAADKSLKKAVALCHMDTSQWSPNHVSFQELGTKPGESEACHWLGDQLDLTFV